MPVNPTSSANPTVGSLITLQVTFKQHGIAGDPTSVSFEFRREHDTAPTTYAFPGPQIYRGTSGDPRTPSGPGVYYIDLNLDASGRWFWGWYATGVGQTVIEGYFDVEPSMVNLPSP